MFGKFPGAVHEGNGTQQLVIEEAASTEQRDAIRRIVYNEDTPGLVTTEAEPIKDPITGAPHRAQIVLPEGFEYTVAEMASGSSKTGDPVPLEFHDTYVQINTVHTTHEGVVR